MRRLPNPFFLISSYILASLTSLLMRALPLLYPPGARSATKPSSHPWKDRQTDSSACQRAELQLHGSSCSLSAGLVGCWELLPSVSGMGRGGDTSPCCDSGERPSPEGLVSAVGVCCPQRGSITGVTSCSTAHSPGRQFCQQPERCWATASQRLAAQETKQNLTLNYAALYPEWLHWLHAG